MNIPINPPAPIPELDPGLLATAKDRVQRNLSSLLNKLSTTVFYRESLALAPLRNAFESDLRATKDDKQLLQQFYAKAPFTSYDDYQPYVSRFFANRSRRSDVENLLAPGLPVFLAHTSGTSGSPPKYFPKYPNPQYAPSPWDSPDAPKISMCGFNGLRQNKLIDIVDDDGQVVQSLPVTTISGGGIRQHLGIGARDDQKIIDKKARFSPIPFAVWLLPIYSSNIFMNSFFALTDPTVVFMNATLSTILYDAIRTLEQNWNIMIEAIEKGILPEIDDLGEYRQHLEAFVQPNPERAGKLRNIDVGSAGWLKKVWPSLLVVRVTLSGQYASLLPKLRHHFGLDVILQSAIYAATECFLGLGYDANDTNLYRLDSNEHIEFLNIDKERTPENLCQPWEVECGKKYEVFVTTNDGLWRYAINDVIEVAGFSPEDGQPLIKYCERKGVGFRVAGEFVSESELQQLVASLSNTLGEVAEFTTEIDDRNGVGAYGFFVELAGDSGSDPKAALQKVQGSLLDNEGYKKYFGGGFIGKPTLRVVQSGTFKDYRDWKIRNTGSTVGQVKVPTTIIDVATREWLAKRVIAEVTWL